MDRTEKTASRSRIRAWLQLFRPPNLFTVPGDPIAGFFLAAQMAVVSWRPAVLVAGAALCFYAGGLAWNDYFDLKKDRYERKSRPLPSGLVRPGAALFLGWLLAIGGLLLCARVGGDSLWIGLVLAACVFCYNRYLKDVPCVGVLAMGACRGLSVLLGASAVPVSHPFTASVCIAGTLVFLYVAAVSQVARREIEPHHPGFEVWMPALVLFIGGFFYVPHLAADTAPRVGFFVAYGAAWVLSLAFAVRVSGFALTANLERALQRKQRVPAVLPGWIGRLIGGLIGLQAAFVLSAGCGESGELVATGLLACWVMNRLLARAFYSS